ncbi:MAG: ABC transporter substrate-binding protein/permease [Streptococcaceae bacterium]|jgi:putative lysine transport system permease protein|nr:ABC transporter substrate-binding protein/permease [Streptococcaceae bacterium]
MKKKLGILSLFIFIISLLSAPAAFADTDTFKVGMEAGYPPFNWTQDTNSNGAVQIEGSNQYANGYDVQVSKQIAEKLGKKLVIVKTKWDGLLPALTSKKLDAIVAGMSPTEERKQSINFSNNYYTSHLVIVTNKDGKYKNAKSLNDFKDAKITAQLGTFHYTVIDQIPNVKKQKASSDFSAMRVALQSGVIDGYVAERPEGVTAEKANSKFKMIDFKDNHGFKTSPDDTAIAVGMRKGDMRINTVNDFLATFSENKQQALMDRVIDWQPAPEKEQSFWAQTISIAKANGGQFITAAGMTLFISLIGTVIGTAIGLLIGVFRTTPKATNKVTRAAQKVFGWIVNIYIEVFRGTPMIVQAMVLYYGAAQAFGINMDRTFAALLIVSINTGAYMSEIVRGGIFAVDRGQFEAAQAIGMTHTQTMRKIILPQVLRNILPATGNEFVINIKDTSVLNVISVAELYFQGNTVAQQNYLYFQTFTIICAIYFVLTFTVTRALRLIERKMDGPSSYEIKKVSEVD